MIGQLVCCLFHEITVVFAELVTKRPFSAEFTLLVMSNGDYSIESLISRKKRRKNREKIGEDLEKVRLR
jgi:hypothetical protein